MSNKPITRHKSLSVKKNTPKLWLKDFPWPSKSKHKYDRGHVVVTGGDENMTGAARLAALSALKTSAGLVTVICQKSALGIYAKTLDAMIMTKAINKISDFSEFLKNKKTHAVVIGPGMGVGAKTRKMVIAALKEKKKMVIDADAITSFAENPQELFSAIKKAKADVVMTPHEGEFTRLFGKIKNRMEDAKKAAKKSGAVIVLKGADTIIAAPDGRVAINANAPTTLATAGSGDVLSGIIGALLASGMENFKAACAAVWVHSECAKICGLGLTAIDLPAEIPNMLKKLKTR